MTKTCSKCRVEKPLTDFYVRSGSKGRLPYSECKECCKARSRVRESDTAVKFDRLIQKAVRLYGEEALPVIERKIAGDPCDICGEAKLPQNMVIDHNHETGEVRGLLCSNCNFAIGLLQEDTAIAEQLIKYLRYYQEGR